MTASAGPCEWCGGHQQWTIIRGEMYVRCPQGCQTLGLEDAVPPHPISEDSLVFLEGLGEGTILRMGGVPRKGADVKASDVSDSDLPF